MPAIITELGVSATVRSWSKLGSSPGTDSFRIKFPGSDTQGGPSFRGRSGNILVVQLRSSIGEKSHRRATLSSLGLNGINSVSLQSDSATVLGQIRSVRDLVGVIELGGVCYKQTEYMARDSNQSFEYIEYGTNTQPGALVRNQDGAYFSFDSDRTGLTVNTSTMMSVGEFAAIAETVDAGARLARGSKASMVALNRVGSVNKELAEFQKSYESEEGWNEVTLSDNVQIVELSGEEALDVIRRGRFEVVAARLAFSSFEATWQAPFAQFIDDDREIAEAGMSISSSKQLDVARAYLRRLGQPGFFEAAKAEVLMRERGVARNYTI